MTKRAAALAIALGCLIGFLVTFTELTEIDPLLHRTVLRAVPQSLEARLRPWCAPLVINSFPQEGQRDVLPRSPLTLTFLTPMNPSSVERNLSLEPSVPGQFSWPDASTLVFNPAQPWPAGARITVELGRGARSWLLRRMARPFTLHFATLASPTVVGTEPSQQRQYLYRPGHIAITFSHLMDEAAVKSHLSIKPPIRDLKLAWTEETLTISGDFQPGTTYEVSINKGAQDAAHGLPMAEDFAWTFTVVESQPALALLWPGRVGMVEAGTSFQLPLTTLNLSRIDLAFYALDRPTFVALQSSSVEEWERYHPEGSPFRAWSVFPGARADQTVSQTVAVDPLPPGLYLLTVNSPEGARTGQLLSVSRSALVLKRAPKQVLVWVVALANRSPAPDYEVTIYERGDQLQRALATGHTDREGVFQSSLPPETGPLLAIAQREDDIAVCAEEWSTTLTHEIERPSGSRVYIATDRPVYYPGQEVHFKAIVRYEDDGRYSLPPADTGVLVVVSDKAGRTVYRETLPLTAFGSVSGSFLLPEEALAGRYRLAVGVGDQEHESYFQVERPHRPGYTVSVTTDQPGYVQGDVITATVSASYDFGVPVAGAEVSYTLYAVSYLPPLPADFDFGWTAQGETRTILSGRGTTDEAGLFTIVLPTHMGTLSGTQLCRDVAQASACGSRTQLCSLDVKVTAPGQQPANASTSFLIHPGHFYIGIQPERRVARTGQEVAFQVRTVDPEGRPQGEVKLQYAFELEGYREEERGSLRTDGQGQARIAFKPATGGVYRLRFEGQDERGNRVTTSTQLWVSEVGPESVEPPGHKMDWRGPESAPLELITDKVRYQVGDVAEVMVRSPYPRATALLTVERSRVMAYRVVELTGSSDIISVPVKSEYFPNAFVSVVLLPDHHSDGGPPDFKTGSTELTVVSAEKELVISLTPDKERYQPGERVVYEVRTADGAGQPVSAEVSLAVVGAASSEMPGIVETLYGRRRLAVRTTAPPVKQDLSCSSQDESAFVKQDLSCCSSQDESCPTEKPIPQVAYWNPTVVTGEDGRARVSFRLPDELTPWQVLAQGVTVDTRVGTAVAALVVSQDLTARLVLPPFLRMGDQLLVEGLLHNHTDKPLETTVTLAATGLELQAPLSHTVAISPGDTARVDWPAAVSWESTATLALSAPGQANAEKAESTVPILPFGEEGGLTDAGGVEDEIALTVSVPKNVITAALTIKGFPSLPALIVDSLNYLRGYPYKDTEQAASWLLAVASLKQALGKLEGEDQQAQTALWRLYRLQSDDGGWGWWEDTRPSPYLTAQAVHSLTRAQKAGFQVDRVVLERGVRALQDNLKDVEDPNLAAYLLYVLAEAGESSPTWADSLRNRQGELAPWARAYLAITVDALGKTDEALDQVADLARQARVTVGTAHWPERRRADEVMTSEISTTALAMQALLQIDPDSPLIPKALDWLIRVQQDGHWHTPRETATVVVALTDYLMVKGERAPAHRYQVLVNGQVVGSGVSTAKNMTVPVKFVVTELVRGDNEVRLIKAGKERLHYALGLEYYWPQDNLEPTRALGGPVVQREYFDPVTDEPRAEYSLGDLIGVQLTVEVPEEMWYVVVEDPLPAGAEAIQGGLVAEAGSEREPIHFEARAEKVAFFLQRLEAGEHVYRYLVRAAAPGRFQAMPALVYPMYEPRLWGRSASAWLQVKSLTFGPK